MKPVIPRGLDPMTLDPIIHLRASIIERRRNRARKLIFFAALNILVWSTAMAAAFFQVMP